jgi:hypothetical protein
MPIITEYTAQYEVQKAIWYMLTNDDVLASLLARTSDGQVAVLDEVQDNQTYPYVQFGQFTETDRPSSFNQIAHEITVVLHTWSNKRSRAEVHQIQNQIIQVLENRQLYAISSWTWFGTDLVFNEVMPDPDGIHYHGILRFRVRMSRGVA